MESRYLLLSLLLCGLLLFGCLGPSETTKPGTQNATKPTTTKPSTGTGTQGTVDPLTISTYSAAVAAGVPLECTAVVSGETMKYWVKGDKMLMSGTTGGRPLTAVLKNNDVYMKLSAEDKASYAQMGLTCDWFLMKGEENETTSGGAMEPTSIDTTSYSGPNVKWSCSAALFGDEKFATTGKSCTGEDLLNAMQTQYQ